MLSGSGKGPHDPALMDTWQPEHAKSFDSTVSEATTESESTMMMMDVDDGSVELCIAHNIPMCHQDCHDVAMANRAPPDFTVVHAQRLHGAPSANRICQNRPWRVGAIYPLITGRLSFVVHRNEEQSREQIDAFPRKFFFSADFQDRYKPFCLDFGPVNLAVIHQFCTFMRRFWKCQALEDRELVYYTENCINKRTNTALLLAAYLMIDHNMTPEQAWAPFDNIKGDAFAMFRDATFQDQGYDLSVLSCLKGLAKAMHLGWYDPNTFDLNEYEFLDNPGNADMHMIAPSLAAFKGPNSQLEDLSAGMMTFPPEHFINIFRERGITTIVRLNEADTYDASVFTNAGFSHHDLYFDDCTVPSNALTIKFLDIVEREKGVAVHCRAGLGRTGVLIAAHMIKNFRFSADEAMGWLRIVRPGSVIGQQQYYLHFLERVFVDARGEAPVSPQKDFCRLPQWLTPEQAAALGDQVARAQAARAQSIMALTALARTDAPGAHKI